MTFIDYFYKLKRVEEKEREYMKIKIKIKRYDVTCDEKGKGGYIKTRYRLEQTCHLKQPFHQ